MDPIGAADDGFGEFGDFQMGFQVRIAPSWPYFYFSPIVQERQ